MRYLQSDETGAVRYEKTDEKANYLLKIGGYKEITREEYALAMQNAPEVYAIGSVATLRPVYTKVSASVYKLFAARVRAERIASVEEAMRMLITEYADGATLHRPARPRVSTGADYLAAHK